MKKQAAKLWRQGDVLIQEIPEIPEEQREFYKKSPILYRGEASGHKHAFKDPNSVNIFWRKEVEIFVEVLDDGASLVHEEHGPIDLEAGCYRIWRQREFDARHGFRWMVD